MNANDLIHTLGTEIANTLLHGHTPEPLTTRHPNITIEDGCRSQQHVIESLRVLGHRIVDKKIGVTSHAVMGMLGVDQPDFGFLLDGTTHGREGALPMARLIRPKAEGEIAFMLKKALKGPGVTTVDVLATTDGVMACLEIVDSRIRDWNIKIQNTVANNASCGMFILGDRMVSPDFYSCGMVLEKNDQIIGVGAGAASMGSPLNAVIWLANTLGRLDIVLEAGEIILSGVLSSIVPVQNGDCLQMEIGGIGCRSVRLI